MKTTETTTFKLFCDAVLNRVKHRLIEYMGRVWIDAHELSYMTGVFALSKNQKNSSFVLFREIVANKQFPMMDTSLKKYQLYR